MLTMGYRGPVMQASQFVDNPLDTMPGRTICLYDYEIAAAIHALNASDWAHLNASQRRQVAVFILDQYRTDPKSKQLLSFLGLNIPSYSQYQILTTQPAG